MVRVIRLAGLWVVAGLVALAVSVALVEKKGKAAKAADSLWPLCDELKAGRFVDLTHAFSTDIPHWKGFPPMKVRDLYTYAKDSFGRRSSRTSANGARTWTLPRTSTKEAETVDQILPEEMLLPLVVINVHQEAAKNPDYVLTVQDVHRWEATYGPIPRGAFVAMRTDWSKRWPDNDAMQNRDARAIAHYPGWGLAVLRFLYTDRGITASGHETTDTDPGTSTSKDIYECETYVLSQNHYQIELLANLDRVPEKGAIVVCSFPKPQNGSGFPARVFAIAP